VIQIFISKMRKGLFLFISVIFLFGNIQAQEKHKHRDDSTHHKRKHRSVHVQDSSSSLNRRAGALLETVFRPEPVLNNADSIIKAFDDQPSFGIYKNNYFVIGTALGTSPSKFNSDVKFQISVIQRLTNSVLPFRTYLFVSYSQLAYWDVFQESFPFGDINFNPTVGLGKAISYKNRFLGTIMFQIEHESNGKDELDSRSWNKISFGYLFKLNRKLSIQSKIWIPIVDGTNNKDIVRYKGWMQFGMDYNYRRFNVAALLTSRSGGFFDSNLLVNLSYKMFKNENQHLFLEYYNGYGENLLFYNKYHHRIRIGFVIYPNFMKYF